MLDDPGGQQPYGHSVGELAEHGDVLAEQGDLAGAAAVFDRAYGLSPDDGRIARRRARLLDDLAVEEHGLTFRYVPAGVRLIGSADGDPDERPVHPVTLPGFWLTDVPVSWAAYCRIVGWSEPPESMPPEPPLPWPSGSDPRFAINGSNRIRLQYCEDRTLHAMDWHAHHPSSAMAALFGHVRRSHPELLPSYEDKPMVSVSWVGADQCAATMAAPGFEYGLPTEAQWETAARGGLVGQRYPWGDEPPTADNCDFDRFEDYSVRPSRTFAPNGYGLYAMCGGVWEWTADWYDSLHYGQPAPDGEGPATGRERVVRGGSWCDPAGAVTVSFRACLPPTHGYSPNIGFRVCRTTSRTLAG